ncbi:MAG TPA: alpha/beta fold hydrolase [Solirubrobacteraceae bacterium]|jgi:poly(3-hydroxyalkanoate) synthetase|nr:alpha/beta fold hydrolase [Solirubrobacteraceae bacterium]
MAMRCPPTFEEIALTDGITAWAAAAEGAVDWWAGALRRGSTPPELMVEGIRWWQTMAHRRRPTWSSPHQVVFASPVARLRDFSPERPAEVVPTLVLPPQAGHDSCIVDFSAEQSQMRTILAAGLERAFTLDWAGATADTKNVGVEDYLEVIDRAVDHAGGSVNLIGDCQGGWLATIYAALRPGRVNTLTIAGAPIDFHCGEPVIHAALTALAPGGNLSFYRGLVAAGGGVLAGEHMVAGFIAIKPDNEIARQLQLLANIDDAEHRDRYREFEDWFKHTQAIPGAFYLWIVEHLFRDNELIAGTLEVAGERVDLGQIACPLNLLAGAGDHITPPDQVFALADYAATAPEDVVRDTTPGGHLGLFMGHEALSRHWPPLLGSVRARS